MPRPVKPKFLVVDDDPSTARFVAAMVAPCGSEVLCAYDGREAVSVARDFHPDCVVTGLIMPGMDGFQETMEILRFLPNCKFVFMSGSARSPEIRDKYQRLGFDLRLLLEKPFRISQLLDALFLAGLPRQLLVLPHMTWTEALRKGRARWLFWIAICSVLACGFLIKGGSDSALLWAVLIGALNGTLVGFAFGPAAEKGSNILSGLLAGTPFYFIGGSFLMIESIEARKLGRDLASDVIPMVSIFLVVGFALSCAQGFRVRRRAQNRASHQHS
jgi:CheY-like chemotaxis protein